MIYIFDVLTLSIDLLAISHSIRYSLALQHQESYSILCCTTTLCHQLLRPLMNLTSPTLLHASQFPLRASCTTLLHVDNIHTDSPTLNPCYINKHQSYVVKERFDKVVSHKLCPRSSIRLCPADMIAHADSSKIQDDIWCIKYKRDWQVRYTDYTMFLIRSEARSMKESRAWKQQDSMNTTGHTK